MNNLANIPNDWTKFYTQYKGLWYRYHPLLEQWWISDTQIAHDGWMFTFDANKTRIDQCFENALNELSKSKSVFLQDEVGQFDFGYVSHKYDKPGIDGKEFKLKIEGHLFKNN